MENIIDKIFPKSADALKGISDSIDKINKMAMAAEKEELLALTCEACHKSIELNEKGDNFYDGEEGTFCIDCQERAETRFEALKDEI